MIKTDTSELKEIDAGSWSEHECDSFAMVHDSTEGVEDETKEQPQHGTSEILGVLTGELVNHIVNDNWSTAMTALYLEVVGREYGRSVQTELIKTAHAVCTLLNTGE